MVSIGCMDRSVRWFVDPAPRVVHGAGSAFSGHLY